MKPSNIVLRDAIIEWNRRRAGYPPSEGKLIDMRLIEKKREEKVK